MALDFARAFGDFVLDTQKSRLYQKGELLELEPQIYGILELLITRHLEVVSRDDMIESIWDGRRVSNYVIDNRIRAVRAAIGDSGRAQRYIKTYPNLGYKFVGHVHVDEDAAPNQIAVQEQTAIKRKPSRLISSITTAAGLCLIALFGLYVVSQYAPSSVNGQPPAREASDDQATNVLALSNDPNDMPRVAVLPFDTIGDRSEYGYLSEVLESEFSHVITAIDGITVVELSAGIQRNEDLSNYKTLREAFDLDYTIASRLSPYSENYKLNVSLIRMRDGKIIHNEAYDLNLSDGESLEDLPAVIASKVTLMVANKLNLSAKNLPQSWENYDFYRKLKEAEAIFENGDYESVKEAVELLREVIAEEPNYVPAYSGLVNYLSWQSAFFLDDFEILYKEQAELVQKMKDISPEAPETLLTNAIMNSDELGNTQSSGGEYNPNDPASVANFIVQKDPDNGFAVQVLAWHSEAQGDQGKTVKAYENLMRLLPTHAAPTTYYSEALFCNKEIRKARLVLDRAAKKIKQLLDQGYINDEEADVFSDVFFDLGYPDLILPHVRNPPRKAKVYAMMGENKYVRKDEAITITRMMVDENYIPEDYYVAEAYESVGLPGDTTKAYFCRIDY